MVALGQAEPGDKTVIDALSPFVEVLGHEIAEGRQLPSALVTSASAATSAAAATSGLRPRKGRARPLADRSIGTPDPGATSFALIVTALAARASTWADEYNRSQAE
jgi:dihydroxyacetone kinase